MKKIIIGSIAILVVLGVMFTAYAQPKGNKGKDNKKDQPGNDNKNKGKDNKDNKGDKGNGKQKDDKSPGNDNKDKDRGNNGNDNKGNNDNKDKNKDHGNKDTDLHDIKWTTATFKDRDKIKNQSKVTLCHKFNRNDESAVTIRVSSNALKAHMNHGDVMGECPVISNNPYSNTFLTRRTDYFNILQTNQEQVLYSRSILDYALERLTNTRAQLITLQNNNAPAAEIERKQVLIVELQQNATLLQQLLGVAANVAVNKLMQ